MVDGKLEYEINSGRNDWSVSSRDTFVNDGNWNFVTADWTKSGDIVTVRINLNYGAELVSSYLCTYHRH